MEQLSLLKTQKISRCYCPHDRSKISCERLCFPFEKPGSKLNVYQNDDAIILQKYLKRDCWKQLQVQTMKVNDGIKKYLNVRHFFPEDVSYVDIFKKNNSYIIKPAKETNLQLARSICESTTGRVKKDGAISLGPFGKVIFSAKCVEVDMNISESNSVMRIFPKDYSDLPYKFTGLSATYQLTPKYILKKLLRLPVAFRQNTEIRTGDILPIYYDAKMHCVVIEGKPGICAVSGKPLHRINNTSKKLIVKPQYADVMPDIQHRMSEISEENIHTLTLETDRKSELLDELLVKAKEIIEK